MNMASARSSAEETALIVNTAVKKIEKQGDASSRELATIVEELSARAGTAETSEIDRYVFTLRCFAHDTMIGALPEGVGGQYNGSITIATSTVEIGSVGVGQTIARMQEVYKHELYHALNHHTDAMMTWDGSPTVIIADKGFKSTEVIEGLTVAETGHAFVSDRYRQHEDDLQSSIDTAGLSLDDVRIAVNRDKNFTRIDDRRRDAEG